MHHMVISLQHYLEPISFVRFSYNYKNSKLNANNPINVITTIVSTLRIKRKTYARQWHEQITIVIHIYNYILTFTGFNN